uniref:Snake venom metalloproteinase crotalin (Fragments) n=1 Tax=Crotalus atrox TaxID=8730 RepID=VM1CR_CROAT|nr:RecName: Full=Snake venom metalloproteinase crotalin; Short=SVMP [Crotalus atrox]
LLRRKSHDHAQNHDGDKCLRGASLGYYQSFLNQYKPQCILNKP